MRMVSGFFNYLCPDGRPEEIGKNFCAHPDE